MHWVSLDSHKWVWYIGVKVGVKSWANRDATKSVPSWASLRGTNCRIWYVSITRYTQSEHHSEEPIVASSLRVMSLGKKLLWPSTIAPVSIIPDKLDLQHLYTASVYSRVYLENSNLARENFLLTHLIDISRNITHSTDIFSFRESLYLQLSGTL